MVYDVTNPEQPKFLQYLNSRIPENGVDAGGDLAPEGIVYVSPEESPTGVAYIIISNETSATLSIYSLDNVLSVDDPRFVNNGAFRMFPNPVRDEVFFSTTDDYKVYDLSGRLVRSVSQSKSIMVNDLQAGMYLVTNSSNQSKKLVIE